MHTKTLLDQLNQGPDMEALQLACAHQFLKLFFHIYRSRANEPSLIIAP